jgi:putative DNA methylase
MAVFHRRRLPHYHAIGQPTFLTWRLFGSLPLNRRFPAETSSGRAFLVMDRILDAAERGPLFLSRPDVAELVVEALHYRDSRLKHYQLHSYVVMPNHVHLLITPLVPVSKLLHSLKRFTAAQANQVLGRTGQPFWQDESYDRVVRNDEEFQRITQYIEINPVRAGLAMTPEGFVWSSAKPIDNRPQLSKLPHKSALQR